MSDDIAAVAERLRQFIGRTITPELVEEIKGAARLRGAYWVRHVGNPTVFLAEWCEDRWAYFGVSGTDTDDRIEVVSDRIREPEF